jgi:hypothetical protein
VGVCYTTGFEYQNTAVFNVTVFDRRKEGSVEGSVEERKEGRVDG